MRIIALVLATLMVWGCKSESERSTRSSVEQDTMASRPSERSSEEINQASEIDIEPISHATAVITWGDSRIFLDPTGGASAFENQDTADFVLITDIHGDHMDPETLRALELSDVPIIVPQAVKDELPEEFQQSLVVLANGETHTENGIEIEAIPMYNLREEALQFHEKGRGNGYVLEKEGIRLYIAGDTEDIPEMRELTDIDIALVPMNLPYTMTVERAADAVIEFSPDQVIPYHYRGTEGFSDVERFKELVHQGNPEVEVVLMEWYPTGPRR